MNVQEIATQLLESKLAAKKDPMVLLSKLRGKAKEHVKDLSLKVEAADVVQAIIHSSLRKDEDFADDLVMQITEDLSPDQGIIASLAAMDLEKWESVHSSIERDVKKPIELNHLATVLANVFSSMIFEEAALTRVIKKIAPEALV